MAKEAASDAIMAPDKLKPLLALSKREPVNAAIGVTADGEGFILLDKKAKPKSVVTMLKASAAKAKLQLNPSSIRYGRAEVDTDYDAGMVRFFINKDAPGNLRMKLVEVVKKISYQKVEINVDPTIDAEEEEGEQEAQEGQTSAATPAARPAPPPPPPRPAVTAIDGNALKLRLTALVQQMAKAIAANPSQKDALMALAKQAQFSLGTNNLMAATQSTDDLEHALAALPAGGEAQSEAPAQKQGPTSGPVAYAKSRLAWLAMRKKMETDLEALRKGIIEFYKDEDIVGDLETRYAERVAPVLENLDESLADALDEATNATDPAQRSKLVENSREIIKRYQDFMASEPIFSELDSNPFVPLAITKTMTATLATLATAIR